MNRTSNYEHHLAEVDYPLAELTAYFEGEGFLKDPRAADIFTHFAREKIRRLAVAAQEVDDEYAEELNKQPG